MFETDRLIIRPFKESDLDRYLNLANDTRVQPTVTNEYIVPLIPKYKEKLNKIVEEAVFFGIVETKPTEDSELDAEARWVGLTTIHTSHPKNRDAIFGIMLDPKHWNKGYGTEVTKWMVDYSFQWLAMHRVSLGVYEGNPRAIDLYKRIGFVEEGRKRKCNWVNGHWEDAISMGILEDEWRASRQRSSS